jgi:hypothetical protein
LSVDMWVNFLSHLDLQPTGSADKFKEDCLLSCGHAHCFWKHTQRGVFINFLSVSESSRVNNQDLPSHPVQEEERIQGITE